MSSENYVSLNQISTEEICNNNIQISNGEKYISENIISDLPQKETSEEKETVIEEKEYDIDVEYDVFVRMSPKNRYTLKAKVTNVRKAEPNIVTPDLSEKEIIEGKEYDIDVEYDVFVRMPPKREYNVTLNIESIKKAEPNIVTPEDY